MRKPSRALVEQGIGEIVLYLPLVLISFLTSVNSYTILAMLTFMVGKWQYKSQYAFHLGAVGCILMSYGTFLCIGWFVNGIGESIWFLRDQPMLAVLISVVMSYGWAKAAKWQHFYKLGVEKESEKHDE